MKMRIVENRKRKEQVIGRILQAFQRKEFPFTLKKSKPPQEAANLPPEGFRSDRDKACFFFFLCFWMAGGILSDQAVRALSKLYQRAPWLFDPYQAQHVDPDDLEWLLVWCNLAFKAKFVKFWWPENARRLIACCDGDPSKLYDSISTFEQACARIRNHKIKTKRMSPGGAPGFIGFQEKMVSMLTYLLMHAGFISPFTFPPPVDIHHFRIILAHEFIRVYPAGLKDLYKPPVIAKARKILLEYAVTHSIDPLDLADAIWGFGRAMCEEHPGNSTRKSKDKRGRKTELTPVRVVWNRAQVRAYMRACGACPVEKTCRLNLPSAEYYIQGRLVIRGLRDKPPLFKVL